MPRAAEHGTGTDLTTRWSRLNGPGRFAGVDLARGLAVVGMLAAHLLVIPDDWQWTDAATWLGLVDGRSSILFATLAGVSIGIVTGRRTSLEPGPMKIARERLIVRAGLLWLLGVLLALTGVPVYVILPAYGILFVLAVPFTRTSARALLITAGIIAVIMPFLQPMLNALPVWSGPGGNEIALLLGWHYPFTLWIAFLLAGMGVARCGIGTRAVQWRMLGGGALAALLGYGMTAIGQPAHPYLALVWTAGPHSSGIGEAVGSGGFAIAVIGGCLLLCTRSGGGMSALGWLALPLRATGAMPLTAYTLQLVAWAVAASVLLGDAGDLGGFRGLGPFWPMTLGTVAFCTAWALFVGRGPLEWATDRLARLGVSSPAPVARLDG